ncbi:MAG: trypsin-like serine protease [Hyphomicrobiales bacterium]|nr:trypsin-like serine protease [Hyphomicrobiales bacterium]
MIVTRKLLKGIMAVGCAASLHLMASQNADAQISNDGASLNNNVTTIDIGAGFQLKKASQVSSARSAPAGIGKSRLPLIDLDNIPLNRPSVDDGVALSSSSSKTRQFGKQASGTSSRRWPYSTARVAVTGNAFPDIWPAQVPVASRPYRLTGKLWARWGSSWYVCTASLIKKGVLVTAAHCVHDFGEGVAGFADEVLWFPANWYSGGGPFGSYAGTNWLVPTPYVNGTDTCDPNGPGVVCNNDIATVILEEKSGYPAGNNLGGWYGYGWNGYSYVDSPALGASRVASITQLGYPVAFDSGYQMQRNHSIGRFLQTVVNGHFLKNTEMGSAMTGGSSGGPWLVNFGTVPNVNTNNASLGVAADPNIVVGVTSWGYITVGVNVQGASWFGQNFEFPNANYGGYGAGNIGALVQATCLATPAAC